MASAQAVKAKGSKLTLEQLEHLTKNHLKFEVQDGVVIIYYVVSCGKSSKDCPGGDAVMFQVCPTPPCPKPTG